MKRRPGAYQLLLVVLAFVGMLLHASIEPRAEVRHVAHQTVSDPIADVGSCPLCARSEAAGAMCAVSCGATLGLDLVQIDFVPRAAPKMRLSPLPHHSLTAVAVLPDAPPPKAFLSF